LDPLLTDVLPEQVVAPAQAQVEEVEIAFETNIISNSNLYMYFCFYM